MSRKLIISLIILILTGNGSYSRGFDMNLPLPGNSIANNSLQFNVLKKIYLNSTKKYPVCSDYKVTDTQLIQPPYDVVKKKGKYVKGYWKEIWTVDACSSTFQVPLTFYIRKSGTEFVVEE